MLKMAENIVKTFNKIMENYPEFKFDSSETNDNSNLTVYVDNKRSMKVLLEYYCKILTIGDMLRIIVQYGDISDNGEYVPIIGGTSEKYIINSDNITIDDITAEYLDSQIPLDNIVQTIAECMEFVKKRMKARGIKDN